MIFNLFSKPQRLNITKKYYYPFKIRGSLKKKEENATVDI